MIIFETERLIVRHYTVDDADSFFQIHGDEEVMRFIRPAKTKEESDLFFQETFRANNNTGMGRWAVEGKNSGMNVGTFCIIPIENQPEKIQLGYALLKGHWGKGYATELTKAGLNHAFNSLGLEVIYAVTEVLNIASQKVLLKSGFKEDNAFVENEKELLLFSISKINRELTGSV